MPIEVRCPNPACDRVHQVKDKYAGMRGRCPACGGWMLIPRLSQPTSSSKLNRPAGEAHETRPTSSTRLNRPAEEAHDTRGETVAAKTRPGKAPGKAPVPERRKETSAPAPDLWTNEDEPTPTPKRRPGKKEEEAPPSHKKRARRAEPEEETFPVADEGDAGDREEAPPPRHFGIFTMLILFLSVLALGAVAAVPFVEQPSLSLTGSLAGSDLEKEKLGVKEEYQQYVIPAAAAVAGLVFLAFLIAMVRGQFGASSLFPAYLALPGAWALAVLAGYIFHHHYETKIPDLQTAAQKIQAERQQSGQLTVNWGQSLYVGLGGAVGGFLLLSFAMFLMHRGFLTRFFFFLLFALLVAGGGAAIFGKELGIAEYIPPIAL